MRKKRQRHDAAGDLLAYDARNVAPSTRVSINRGNLENGKVKIEKVADTVLKREDRWLGQ